MLTDALVEADSELETDCDSETEALSEADSEVETDCDSDTDTLAEADSEFDTDFDSETDALSEADSLCEMLVFKDSLKELEMLADFTALNDVLVEAD